MLGRYEGAVNQVWANLNDRRSAYVELLKLGSLLVKRRWTRSSASMSCFRHGDQTTELLSTSGLT